MTTGNDSSEPIGDGEYAARETELSRSDIEPYRRLGPEVEAESGPEVEAEPGPEVEAESGPAVEARPDPEFGFEPDSEPWEEFDARSEGEQSHEEAKPAESPAPPPATFARQMLSSAVRWVWFVGYLLPSLGVTLIALQFDIFLLPTRTGLVTAATLVVTLALSVWRTLTRYRNWSWELDETELIIDRGVVFKLTRVVPRVRVQHVDLSSGPIDRIFNLRQVSIYTAGTREADATIPGLTSERAEALRRALITR